MFDLLHEGVHVVAQLDRHGFTRPDPEWPRWL
jgi:hypothetical protein